ncbi:MAG: imelysin family protein [Hymenobacteraceae bacterium]|nr:imelysin family protein [Hymenobacteraceae bacterium]MDX5396234.1 imelysin family protein [Hymenobacteraceae bacterium]MDX5442849.1 imelysin family protein [Hymenobacteraceae bacterium]MDX5512297.1 imelysin family protein [Hymenobacteraceae bacterium]
MQKIKMLLSCCLLGSLVLNTACDNDDDTGKKQEYDRQAMLVNQGQNVIVPAFEQLKNETGQLNTAVAQFTANPTTATLQAARQELKEAYLAWQEVAMFQFGPADQVLLRQELNTFPTNTDSINNRISNGATSLASANPAAKGFPAAEYLLFSNADDNQVIASFTTAANAANRSQYLSAVTTQISQAAAQVYSQWNPGNGNYIKTFTEATGTSVGSATSDLVNQLNNDLDIVKRYKVGIPSGVIGGQLRPTSLEGYYSGYSLQLLRRNIEAQRNVFMGIDRQGNNGQGLDDYLNFLEAKYQNQLLSEAIIAKYNQILQKINSLPEPLSQSVASHNQQVAELYQLMQELIVLTKTDMPSAMGISITYQDNDGD